jgi:two-component system, LuxR family, response regulator FixJ
MHVVAVVDDEEPVRRSMVRLLRGAGYDVASFAGGEAFFDWLTTARAACVLVDGQMPGMDGREVLRRLSRQPALIPAIVVSGRSAPLDRRAATELGAVAFFAKPFDPAKLLEAVAGAVAPKV